MSNRNVRELRTPRWCVGLMTCTQRYNNMDKTEVLSNSEASLSNAGFEIDHIQVDRDHEGPVGCFLQLAWSLFVKYPVCDRYLIIQDDVIFPKNLRQYLETLGELPHRGYWNLYITPENEQRVQHIPGFHKSNQMGRGALALAFSNHALRRILSSRYFVDKLLEASPNYRKSLDRAIVKGCEEIGGAEYVHWPSLCYHIGEKSTLGNKPDHSLYPESWIGEDFDCMTLVEEKERSIFNGITD